MASALRVLIVEDSPDDAELVLRRLSRAGFEVSSKRVEDAEGLHSALTSAAWDIILADYNLPGFSGLDAIHIVNAHDADIPLILVSGAIDVPTALVAMKAGARDFIPKDDTQRLPSIIEREVSEAAERRLRRSAEAERDRALAELQESSSQLEAFAALADVTIRGTTFDHFLGDLLAGVADAARADGATILLAEGDRLVTRGAVGPSALLEREVAFGAGFAGVVAADDRPMFIRDLVAGGLDTALGGCGVHSTMGVPMHHAGRVIGVLHVDWCEPCEPPAWQLPLLEIAADRCATMIENARLFEREHTIAETLQQALLSASTQIARVEVGQFYASATVDTLVGGDFYDVFELDENRVAFSIGDVCGKGLHAARVTALAKNAIRTIAVEGVPPSDVLARSNDVLRRFTEAEMFVTGVFGVLNVTSGEVTYSNAGHPPPAVIGPFGVRLLSARGPLLGVLDRASFSLGRTTLAPGESVVLYTDGLTEARTADGAFYGMGGLEAILDELASDGASPQEAASRLFEEVWEFSGGRLRDDIAVVVIRPASTATPAG